MNIKLIEMGKGSIDIYNFENIQSIYIENNRVNFLDKDNDNTKYDFDYSIICLEELPAIRLFNMIRDSIRDAQINYSITEISVLLDLTGKNIYLSQDKRDKSSVTPVEFRFERYEKDL